VPQTCYRHPNRETNVACSNCERPICPDCMVDTPVGMRCPECAGRPTGAKRAAAVLGSSNTPYATYTLIALNVLVFFAEVTQGSSLGGFDASGEIFFNGALYGPLVADGEWYRLVTSGFLHAGIIHLAFNMFVLFVLGKILEPSIGTPRFVAIYFVGLLAGSLGALLLDPRALTVGASGAIFGLMAATFIIARHRGVDQVASQIGIWIIINLAFSFGVSSISLGGHLGGLVGGGLAALIIAAGERQPRGSGMPLEIGGLSVMAAVAIAGAILFANSL
jgi:membrane associated rhomboid family serine protease